MTDGATPSTLSGPTRAPTSTRRAVLNTIRGSAGNLVEWYDVYVYTVFATYFEAQFFDKNDDQLNGVHLRDLRGHLRHATGGILVLRPVRRPSRPQGRPDAEHHRHVVLLLPRGGHAHPRDHRVLGGGDSGPRPARAGVRHWWRVRHIGDIHVRSGNRESAWLLVVFPVRHPHRRSRSRPVHTPHRAPVPGCRRAAAPGDGGSASSSVASPPLWCSGFAARWTSRSASRTWRPSARARTGTRDR